MTVFPKMDLRERWDWALGAFDEAVRDLARASGDAWGELTFLDVPSFLIAELIPSARAAGLTEGFDLHEKVRESLGRIVRRRRKRSGGDVKPYALQFGLTEAILTWEWTEMERAGDPAWSFFDRLRELRLRLPEVALDERATHRFCERVPPPRIME